MTSERIERVVNLKSFTKDQLEAEARQRRWELNTEKEKLERLENLLSETSDRLKERQKSGLLDTKEICLFYDYISHMEKQIKNQKEIVKKKQEMLMEKEREVMNAHREKRLLEILHNNALKDEIREAISREQKEMDLDFIMRRHRR